MIKGVLFDLDNTIIDFMKMKNAACEAAMDAMIEAGLTLDKKHAMAELSALWDKFGIEYQRIFDEFLLKMEGRVDYKKLARGILAYRSAKASHLVPYPGVRKTLLALKQKGLQLCIVTDAPRLEAWLRLAGMNLEDFFDHVVTFDDTGKLKPHKEPFEQALMLMKLKPSQVMMVGDNCDRDMAGARSLGITTCLAAYGSREPRPADADHTLGRCADILARGD